MADDGEEPRADGPALEEQVESLVEVVGGSKASVQFMITRAMRDQLAELGYTNEQVDALDPQMAAKIVAKRVVSSKLPQAKAKTKRDRFEMQFTCNICDAPNSHSISRHAYTKGTVIVTCPGCNSTHLIADNLNWIEDDFKNLEEFMEKRGTPVKRIVNDGVAASAAANAARVGEAGVEADLEEKPLDKVDGISDEQARRIREAVRAHKRKRNQ
jgi:protein import protein ZIM17